MGAGSGETTGKPLYLLDLFGNIVEKFASGCSLSRFLNKTILSYKYINTPSVTKTKYRIVTPIFYDQNRELILSWRNYFYQKDKPIPPKKYKLPKVKIVIIKESFKPKTLKQLKSYIISHPCYNDNDKEYIEHSHLHYVCKVNKSYFNKILYLKSRYKFGNID